MVTNGAVPLMEVLIRLELARSRLHEAQFQLVCVEQTEALAPITRTIDSAILQITKLLERIEQ
jgi:hypothetical protein